MPRSHDVLLGVRRFTPGADDFEEKRRLPAAERRLVLADGATTNVWAFPTAGGPMKPLTDFRKRTNVIARNVSWSADSQSFFVAVAENETDVVLFDGLIR